MGKELRHANNERRVIGVTSPAVRVEDLNFAFFSVDFLIKPGRDNTR
jgi:hypothetical protein